MNTEKKYLEEKEVKSSLMLFLNEKFEKFL